MEIYRLVQVYSPVHMQEDVYNDKKVALEAFAEAQRTGFVRGARLYTCEFVNGKLTNKECLVQKR